MKGQGQILKIVFLVLFGLPENIHISATVQLRVMKFGHGSGSKVTWVNVKGQIRPKGHDIGSWAHANVKLHFFLLFVKIHSYSRAR